jgi:hypothetical protein
MDSAILAVVGRQQLAGIMDITRNYSEAVFPTMDGPILERIEKLLKNSPQAQPIPVYLYETG